MGGEGGAKIERFDGGKTVAQGAKDREHAGLIYEWNEKGRRARPHARPILFDDETLRDGLQSPSVTSPSLEQKAEILRSMARLGIPKADLGLPGAGPQHLAHIEALLRVIVEEKLPIRPGCAVRTVAKEIEPIATLQQKYGIAIQASAFLGASRIRKYVEDWSDETLLGRIDEAIGFATRQGIPTMFVTEDTTRSHPDDLRRLYTRALDQGARALCIADTCGYATPHGTRQVVRAVTAIVEAWGDRDAVELNWHGHEDRGLGVANCIAAVEAGADCVHGTALGIGERVGNAPMDQILVNFKLMGWIEHDLSALPRYVELVSRATGTPVPRQYPVVGEDAFETATGVHAAAVVKALKKGDPWLADRVYSAIPAREFGLEQKILVGHMSGKSNVTWWLEKHGYPVTPEAVERILAAAKAAPKPLSDAELARLAAG